MREEVLRMDRVTYEEQGVTELNRFCLNQYAGEIMGLVPVNDTGLEALYKLLTQNLPIHYGYVYYRGRMVNQWKRSDYAYNRVGVIRTQSGLADDLTVADNVFVMRHGFRKRLIQRRVLEKQLEPFLREINVHLPADAVARELSPYHRLVTELVRAVVADCRLIVLVEPGTVIGDERLKQLHQIMRHYASQGFSFLYVSRHFEEAVQVCDRAALMLNGQIVKLMPATLESKRLVNGFGTVERYTAFIKGQGKPAPAEGEVAPALELDGLRFGQIRSLTLRVAPGECVVLQDMNNHIFEDLIQVLAGEKAPAAGTAKVGGRPISRRDRREVAIVQKMAAESMLFPELSYMDNLCFAMDHLLPRVWRSHQARESVLRECREWLGTDLVSLPVEALSRRQKYDLVYTRVLLQNPRVAVCVQPFMQADVEHRMHIWTLLERLTGRGVAVVILAVNLADSLAFADRLIRVRDGAVQAEYPREAFGSLPENTPLHELWSGENNDQHGGGTDHETGRIRTDGKRHGEDDTVLQGRTGL